MKRQSMLKLFCTTCGREIKGKAIVRKRRNFPFGRKSKSRHLIRAVLCIPCRNRGRR